MTEPSARSAGISEAEERRAREVSGGAQQKTIPWIVFRRERVGIYDDPEYRCLSP